MEVRKSAPPFFSGGEYIQPQPREIPKSGGNPGNPGKSGDRRDVPQRLQSFRGEIRGGNPGTDGTFPNACNLSGTRQQRGSRAAGSRLRSWWAGLPCEGRGAARVTVLKR